MVQYCGTALVSSEISTSYKFLSGFLVTGQAFLVEKRFELGRKSEDSWKRGMCLGRECCFLLFSFWCNKSYHISKPFLYSELEQEGLGGSSAWSGLHLRCPKLCGWVLRWRASCGCGARFPDDG